MGASTGYSVAQKGASCLVLEQFGSLDHKMGSSHGDGRIFRLSYPGDIDYTMMASTSYDLWRKIEATTNSSLLSMTGGLSIFPSQHPEYHKCIETFDSCNLDYEIYTQNSIKTAFPQFHFDKPDIVGVFQAQSGVLRADKVLVAFRDYIISQPNCQVQFNKRVASINPQDNNQVTVTLQDGTTYHTRSVVLALGAWTGKFLKEWFNIQVPISVQQQTVSYYLPVEGTKISHHCPNMPIAIIYCDVETNEDFYLLPEVDIKGVKVGLHGVGPVVDPDNRSFSFPEKDRIIKCTQRIVERYLPHLQPIPSTNVDCLYCMTPDSDFILDTLPQYPNVILAAGFSGHGFKFASIIGETAASIALQQSTPKHVSLQKFSLARFNK